MFSDKVLLILAILIFIATYASLLIFSKHRYKISLISAVVFLILGISPIKDIFSLINFNVLMMIAGTMGIVSLFIKSQMPARLADIIISKVPNLKWAIIVLSFFAGLVSAFIDNVATVLIVAPIAISLTKKLKTSPVPAIICISIASNLQGAATLVGDTTSILLGAELNMNFLDFFFYNGKPGLFFITQAGAILATLILLIPLRRETLPIDFDEKVEVEDYFPTYLLIGMIVLLILVSLFDFSSGFLNNNINGLIVIGLLIVGLVYEYFKTKEKNNVLSVIKDIDYETILLLVGLFIVIGGLVNVGLMDIMSDFILKIAGNNLFITYTIIVFGSVLISAFIDNIPYVITMLPVVAMLSTNLGFSEPSYVLYFGLLVGSTLGGNLTPIGASANITGLGILRKEGYEVSAKGFMKYSVPFTLTAVFTGYILTWLLFS